MKIGIIGGGASGIMAAYGAAFDKNNEVTILEKNDRIGKKLYITGKGRCNITNSREIEELMDCVVKNRNFLYSSFYTFTNEDIVKLLNNTGLKTKVERGDRVFPISDKSIDVIKTFEKILEKNNCKILLKKSVQKIEKKQDKFLVYTSDEIFEFDKLIVATGGVSYRTTGSSGDGYEFAKKFGHTIISPKPSLVPILVKDTDIKELQGLTLTNINLDFKIGKNKYSEFGDLMFMKNGITGPTVLRASSKITHSKDRIKLSIDLKPALDFKKLDERILRDLNENSNKSIINALEKISTKSIIPLILERSSIQKDIKAHQLTKEQRMSIVENIKSFKLIFNSLDDINNAIITSGGISVKEIDSSTMESKLIKNLYFSGEIIDVDALTGGYNLQIAFSTGYLAGISSTKEE